MTFKGSPKVAPEDFIGVIKEVIMERMFLFTHERLSKLPIPEKGRVEYFDTKQQKLRLRVSSSRVMSFAVVKKVHGKPKRVTVGKWPEISIAKAREEAIKILDDLRHGIDPVQEKRKKILESTALGDVLEMYLTERKLKPITQEGYRYKLNHSFKAWLDKPISSITDKMVLKRHKELSKIGATTANTSMRVLRLTMNYAHAIGLINEPPTSILSKARLWHKPKRKDRVIHSKELKAWHEAVEALSNEKAKVYLLMILYMGFRSSEALTLEWEHVDLQAKSITLYDTKNGTNHTLPIPSALIPFIQSLHCLTGRSRWVFLWKKPVSKVGVPDRPMSLPKKQIKDVIEASGVEFSPHDCRRTFASIAEGVSLPLITTKRLMNHVTTNDVTGGYIILEEETLREAINKIASYITAKVSSESNVIKLNIVS
tara:strand:+ start:428 stop:1708 length:1281 start_codon:yes stop_codon:yes gene_type:complete